MSAVPDEREIRQLQDETAAYLPDRVQVYRRTDATSDFGGEADTFAAVGDLVPAKIGPQSVNELLRLGAADVEAQAVIVVKGGTDVRQSDQLESGGRRWDVMSVGSTGGTWEVTVPVLVREVT